MPLSSMTLLSRGGPLSAAIAKSIFNARLGVLDSPVGTALADGASVARWYSTDLQVSIAGSPTAPVMDDATAPGIICPVVGTAAYFTLAVDDNAATLEGGMVAIRFSAFGTLHQVIANRPTSTSGTTKSAFFLAVTDTGSAVKIECAVSVGDTWKTITDTTTIAYADKLKAMTLHFWIDRGAGTINLIVNGGSVQSLSIGATPNTQSGPVFLFSEYTSGSPVVSDDTLVVLGAELLGTAVTADDLAEFTALEAALTAPVVDASPSISVVSGSTTTVDLSDLVSDPTGYGWEVDEITTADPFCTVAVNGSDATKIDVTPAIASGTAFPVLKVKTSSVFTGTTSFTLTINIAAVAAGGAYSNGFTNRFPLKVGAGMVEGDDALVGLLQKVRITSASLKTTGNGGAMQDSAAKDFRIELAGTKIPHVVLAYDGSTTGQIDVLVLRSSLQDGDGTVAEAYWGKDVSSVTEEDPTGTFANEALFVDLSTGADLAGKLSDDLTITGITAGAGPFGNAGIFDGSHFGTLAEQFLNGSAGVTWRMWAKLNDNTGDHALFALGDVTSLSSAKTVVFAARVGFHSQTTNTLTAEIQSTDARNRTEGQSGLFTTDTWQQIAARAYNGAAPLFMVDDQVVVNADTSAPNALGGNLVSASPITVGKERTTYLRGAAAYLCADNRTVPIPKEHIITEARNGKWPAAFCGASRVETVGDDTRIIAGSIWATASVGATIPLDPVSESVGSNLTITGTPTATAGTVTLSGNVLSFVAPSSEQLVTISYSLTDGTQTIAGTILVNVTGAAVPPPSSDAAPWDGLMLVNPTHGVSPQATQIKVGSGIINGFRWVAHRSGFVTGLRLIMRAAIAGGPTGPGYTTGPGAYSTGNGGKITLKLRLQNADGSVGTILGTGPLNNGLAGNLCAPDGRQNPGWGFYDVWTLTTPVAVTKGTKYWFEFQNTSTDAGDNWISMDTMVNYANVPLGLTPPQHAGIFYGDEIVCYGRYDYTNAAALRNNMGGLFVIHYSDGINDGNPWQFTASEARKTAGGSVHLRQRFTVTYATVKVSALWVWCWWKDPATTSLSARLEDSTGAMIQAVTFARSNFVQTANSQVAGDAYATWAKANFGSLATLTKGQEYFIHFSASAGGYEFCPQQLYAGGDGCRNAPVGYAEYSTNGGSTWKGGWDRNDQAGNYQKIWWLPTALVVSG